MFKEARQIITQSPKLERPYTLDEYGRLPFEPEYKPTQKDFPFLLRDALQGIGGTYSTGTTVMFGELLGSSPAENRQKMTPFILIAVTHQMQVAHNIIDTAPQREAQIREKITREGIGYTVRDEIVDAPNNTAAANQKLVQALAVLRHVANHASKYINPDNAGSLPSLLVDTLVKESVNPSVRGSAGYYLEDILQRNPTAFATPERATATRRTQPQKTPKV